MSEHNHDAQEIKEILDVVADRVPKLLNELRGALFSEQAGQDLGRAVGAFYRELVASGIPAEEALGMAKSYIGSISSMVRQVNVSGKEGLGMLPPVVPLAKLAGRSLAALARLQLARRGALRGFRRGLREAGVPDEVVRELQTAYPNLSPVRLLRDGRDWSRRHGRHPSAE